MGKLEQLSFKEKKGPSIKRLLVFSVCVFAAALAVLIAGFAYIYHITPPDSNGGTIVDSIRFMVKPGETAFRGKDRMIILCLGVDNNYTDQGIMYTKGARTDTIFLLSVDSNAEAVNVLSIPRDTWVEITPEQGFDKINAAFAYGGIDQAKKTISRFLDTHIDHYIILKVKSTENMVNALGGIEVDVEKDMDYDDNWGHLHVHLKKGTQLLNGAQAVGYARFRHDEESDWGRIRRQQQVMNALIKEMKKPSNVLRIEKIVKVIHESIETDLTIPQMLDLARLYKDFDRSNMKTGVIKGDDGGGEGYSYIVPYENEKTALVRRLLLRDTSIPPSEVRVGVLNGTSKEGLATRLADTLTKRGYTVTRIADADRSDYTCSRVIDRLNDRKLVNNLEEFIGPNEYVGGDAAKPDSEEDITIVIGSNWLDWKENQKKLEPGSSLKQEKRTAGHQRVRKEIEEIPYPAEEEPLQVIPGEKPVSDEKEAPQSVEPADNAGSETVPVAPPTGNTAAAAPSVPVTRESPSEDTPRSPEPGGNAAASPPGPAVPPGPEHPAPQEPADKSQTNLQL